MDLFSNITIPDLRDKEAIKKASKPGSSEAEKKAKPLLTLTQLKDIQAMFAYETDYEMLDKALPSRTPQFKFVPPSREVVERLIVRASAEKELF